MTEALTAGEIWKDLLERRSDAFDPLTDVPTTDEEAIVALQRDVGLLTDVLQGLYGCFRAKGETVLEAFRLALEAHVAAIEEAGN